MNASQPDRRQRDTDLLMLVLNTCTLLGWSMMIALQVIVWLAAPELDTGIVRYHQLELREYWRQEWVQFLPWGISACAVVTLITLILRPLRARRKNDPKYLNLLFLLLLIVVVFCVYWFRISGNTG